jgi:WD40 repeat protein
LSSTGQGPVYSARLLGGNQVITACGDGAIRLWDARTGALRQTYGGGSRFLVDATLSADRTMLIGGGGDGQLGFWEVSSGRRECIGRDGDVLGVASVAFGAYTAEALHRGPCTVSDCKRAYVVRDLDDLANDFQARHVRKAWFPPDRPVASANLEIRVVDR